MGSPTEKAPEFPGFDLIDLVDEARGPLIGVAIVDRQKSPKLLNVRVDDWHGSDRKRPRVTIEYDNGSAKSFDIIGSIYANSASIGHPLILVAIRRWERVVQYYYARSRDRYHASRIHRGHINRYRMAKSHLESVGRALLEGAQSRALTKEASFTIQSSLEFFPESLSYLSLVWKVLGEDEIKRLRSVGEKIRILSEKLSARPEDMKWITDFLESPLGSRCLAMQSDWPTVRNAFDAWRYRYPTETVKRYRSEVKRQEIKYEEIDLRSLIPEECNKYNAVEQWLPAISLKPLD